MLIFLATLAVFLLATLTTLGNFYYTYGIWPQSWGAFILFAIIQLIVVGLANALSKELSD